MIDKLIDWVNHLPWGVAILLCLTLGLAPFTPPHIWEKLQMLFKGELVRPLDWFDFFLHGIPWLILLFKLLLPFLEKSGLMTLFVVFSLFSFPFFSLAI